MKSTIYLGSIGDVDETAISFVQVEKIRLSEEIVREKNFIALWHLGVFNVVAHIEIEISVPIVVPPRNT